MYKLYAVCLVQFFSFFIWPASILRDKEIVSYGKLSRSEYILWVMAIWYLWPRHTYVYVITLILHTKTFFIIKDVGMDITTNKLNWRHRYTTPWRIHHTILLLSWQTTKPYGYFCTFKTDIAIPLPRLLITACNAKSIIFIPVTDVTIRLPVLSMTSYHNCTQFALIGDTLTDISSLIHVWPSW